MEQGGAKCGVHITLMAFMEMKYKLLLLLLSSSLSLL